MKQVITFLKEKNLTNDEIKMILLSMCSNVFWRAKGNQSLEKIIEDAQSEV